MTLEWNESYATGNADMDAQHRHLFALINSMMQAHTIEDIKPLLMQLYRYTREHFQQEEACMSRLGYPGLAAHVRGHAVLLDRLNAFSEQVGQGRLYKAELVKMMSDWALNHIVHDDIEALAYVAPAA